MSLPDVNNLQLEYFQQDPVQQEQGKWIDEKDLSFCIITKIPVG